MTLSRDPLTLVEIVFLPDYLNHWLRFGTPGREHALDRRRSLALFAPGRVFGYVRWRANEYGTRGWRFTVVETAGPGCAMSRIEGVHPGGHILLSADGAARVKRALAGIDALEAAGFEPPEIPPAYYRHIHNRIATGQPIRPYDHGRHAVYRMRRLGFTGSIPDPFAGAITSSRACPNGCETWSRNADICPPACR